MKRDNIDQLSVTSSFVYQLFWYPVWGLIRLLTTKSQLGPATLLAKRFRWAYGKAQKARRADLCITPGFIRGKELTDSKNPVGVYQIAAMRFKKGNTYGVLILEFMLIPQINLGVMYSKRLRRIQKTQRIQSFFVLADQRRGFTK